MPDALALQRFDQVSARRTSVKLEELTLKADAPEVDVEPLEPVIIQASPEQLKLAEAHQMLEANQARLASLVHSIGKELHGARQRVIVECTDIMAQAIEALLPSLLDSGFAREIADATLKIATAVEPERVTLKVHPDDHDSVVDALRALASPEPIIVEQDTVLNPGQVRLAWQLGGADIDQAQLLQHATGLINARLASFESGKDQG